MGVCLEFLVKQGLLEIDNWIFGSEKPSLEEESLKVT